MYTFNNCPSLCHPPRYRFSLMTVCLGGTQKRKKCLEPSMNCRAAPTIRVAVLFPPYLAGVLCVEVRWRHGLFLGFFGLKKVGKGTNVLNCTRKHVGQMPVQTIQNLCTVARRDHMHRRSSPGKTSEIMQDTCLRPGNVRWVTQDPKPVYPDW